MLRADIIVSFLVLATGSIESTLSMVFIMDLFIDVLNQVEEVPSISGMRVFIMNGC